MSSDHSLRHTSIPYERRIARRGCGPHFEYLTASYVDYLGLEPWLRPRPEPVIAYWFSDHGVYPATPMMAYDWVVVYNHALYVRSLDKRSWDRLR